MPILFALPEISVVPIERLLTTILIISLIALILSQRQKIFFIPAITSLISLISLISFDQMRLQPWVYQYLLLLTIFALHNWETEDDSDSNRTLGLLQIMIAGLYFWSGVQKMNFTFSHETLPMLLSPLQNLFPSIQLPFVFFGISIALTETLIGAGLLFRKTKRLSVLLAVTMHATILGLLIAKDYNSIVWIWNAVLMLIVVIAFWKNDVSIKQSITSSSAGYWKVWLAKSVTLASVLLPILSFAGWWDMYLSGALYSGNTPVAVIRINEDTFGNLPAKAQQTVFRTKSRGEQMLPLFEWAIADLNVPTYPEIRVFKQVAREMCKLTNDKGQVELIIKERPAIFDGNYEITQISCLELEKN